MGDDLRSQRDCSHASSKWEWQGKETQTIDPQQKRTFFFCRKAISLPSSENFILKPFHHKVDKKQGSRKRNSDENGTSVCLFSAFVGC